MELYEAELTRYKESHAELESENDALVLQLDSINQKGSLGDVNSGEALGNEQNRHTKFKLASEVKLAPRLFCDICDEFDLHDTEDCPQQSMPVEMQQKEAHSQHNVPKKSNRAYCDLCESFGHEETECTSTAKTNNGDKPISDEEF